MKIKIPTVNEQDYLYAVDNNTGWCRTCEAFTTDHCEPDARNYQCYECNTLQVFGAEEALISAMFILTDFNLG